MSIIHEYWIQSDCMPISYRAEETHNNSRAKNDTIDCCIERMVQIVYCTRIPVERTGALCISFCPNMTYKHTQKIMKKKNVMNNFANWYDAPVPFRELHSVWEFSDLPLGGFSFRSIELKKKKYCSRWILVQILVLYLESACLWNGCGIDRTGHHEK